MTSFLRYLLAGNTYSQALGLVWPDATEKGFMPPGWALNIEIIYFIFEPQKGKALIQLP